MFPEGNFLVSAFGSGPIPATTLVIDLGHAWVAILTLLASCGPVLWLLTKPSTTPEPGARAHQSWRNRLSSRTPKQMRPATTLPRRTSSHGSAAAWQRGLTP